MTSSNKEALEAEIARQREEVATTIDALGHKLDVKSRAGAKAADLKDRATTSSGQPRPEVIVVAGSLVAAVVVLVIWRRRRA
jgi:hypothetical protein